MNQKCLGFGCHPPEIINFLRLAALIWEAKLRLGRSSQAEAWKALNTYYDFPQADLSSPSSSDTDRYQ